MVELMVVVSIIGVLAAIAIPIFLNYLSTSKKSTSINNFDTAVRVLLYEKSKRVTSASLKTDIVSDLNYGGTGTPYDSSEPAFIEGNAPIVLGQVSLSTADLSTLNRGDTFHIEVHYIDPDTKAVVVKEHDEQF